MPFLNIPRTWFAFAGSAFAAALVFLGAMLAANPHVWTGSVMITAYALGAAALGSGLVGVAIENRSQDPARPAHGLTKPLFPEVAGPPRGNGPADGGGQLGEPELAAAGERPVAAGPVIADRWRQTSNGAQVPALMNLTHTVMFHPGYSGRQPGDTPPSARIGVVVASRAIDPAASGTELRAEFAAFLGSDTVMMLIESLTHVDPAMSWKSLAGNGPRTLEAALTLGDDALAGVPVASALLLLPVAGESLYGRDGRSATLLLQVEPRTAGGQVPPSSSLEAWYECFSLALAVPGAFAGFLASDLGLDTCDDPPAQLGIWLQSYHSLTSMIDSQELRTLPGASPSNWFAGWAFASRDGEPGQETARGLLGQLCEYTLHLDAFEQKLDQISAAGRRKTADKKTSGQVAPSQQDGRAGASGDVTNTISGGDQRGPVVQGRDFFGLTFGSTPHSAPPGPDGTT